MDLKRNIVKFIDLYDYNVPIFKEDIKTHILKNIDEEEIDIEKLKNNLNVIIYRLIEENIIKQKIRGVYYKPTKTIFGESTISNKVLIERRFLIDAYNNIKGYIVGAKLYNMLGLTTQVPNITDIVTNECKYHKIYNDTLRINIYKPKISINNDNYLYLQLLDFIENKENINIENDNFDETIFLIIEKNNLEFEKLIKYARTTNNKKAIKKLVEIAR